MFGPLLEVVMTKKCTPLWREAHFQSQKKWRVLGTFGRSDVVSCGRRKGSCTLSKSEQDVRVFCISRGRRSKRDMFIRDVRRSGRWFPQKLHFGASDLQFWEDDFVWQVQRFVWPGIIFCGRQSTLDRWSRKTARRIGRRPSALHSTFHFWGMSRRNAAFLMLSTWKDEEVSQNSFVFKLADR